MANYSQTYMHKTKVLEPEVRAALADPKRLGLDRRTVTGRRNWTIIRLLAVSGLRAAEAAGLRFGNIERCNVDGQAALVLTFAGKGGRVREIPLVGDSAAPLLAWLDRHPTPGRPSDPVFPGLSKHGKPMAAPMTADAVHSMVRRAGLAAGVEGIHPHRFRHTVATTLAENDVPLDVIMSLLGHSSPATTMRYITASRTRKARGLALAAGL